MKLPKQPKSTTASSNSPTATTPASANVVSVSQAANANASP